MSFLAAVLHARLLAAGMTGTSPVSVVVDAAVVDREALAARLVAGTEPLARRLSPALGPSPSASIVVSGELLDFRVHLALSDPEAASASRCPCTHAELVAHVQQHLAQAVEARPAAAPSTLAPRLPPPRPEPEPERATPTPSPAHQAPPAGLGRPGRFGLALLGLGGLGLGAGAGVLIATHRVYDETFMLRTDLRSHGVVTMAIGSAVLASGAVLLLLDRHHRRARLETHP